MALLDYSGHQLIERNIQQNNSAYAYPSSWTGTLWKSSVYSMENGERIDVIEIALV